MRTGGSSPKILFIAPEPFYEDRGTPILIYEEIKILSELGFCVDLATYPIGADISLSGIQIVRVKNPMHFRAVPIGLSLKKVFLDVILFFKILRLVCKGHYDCIHGVEEGAGIALFCKLFWRTPFIYDMHSRLPDQLSEIIFFRTRFGKNIAVLFEKLLLHYSNAVLASSGLVSHVLSVVPGKAVWEFSIFFDSAEDRNKTLANNLNVLERPTVVYTGNFSSYQGVDMLLEAAAILCKEIPDVVVILVGGTRADMPPIYQRIKKLNLEKTIQLHPRVPRSEVSAYLGIADVLVLPRPKGMNAPLKIFDYLKSKKPIVATDIPAHNTLLTPQTALLVKPESLSLARGLLEVLKNKDLARNIASNAFNTEKSLSNNLLRNAMVEIYRSVLKS